MLYSQSVIGRLVCWKCFGFDQGTQDIFYYIVVQSFSVELRCYKSTKILKLLLPDIFHVVCVDLD